MKHCCINPCYCYCGLFSVTPHSCSYSTIFIYFLSEIKSWVKLLFQQIMQISAQAATWSEKCIPASHSFVWKYNMGITLTFFYSKYSIHSLTHVSLTNSYKYILQITKLKLSCFEDITWRHSSLEKFIILGWRRKGWPTGRVMGLITALMGAWLKNLKGQTGKRSSGRRTIYMVVKSWHWWYQIISQYFAGKHADWKIPAKHKLRICYTVI